MKRARTIVKELESSGARLAALQRQQDDLASEISRAKKEHDLGVERMIIDIVRRNGIANLPIADIVASLDRLAKAEDLAGDRRPEEAPGPRDDVVAAAEQADAAGEPGAETFVKISSNASADNRQTLENAGLRWNGKRGGYIGRTDAATIARLRETFGARVLKPVQVSSSEPQHVTLDKDGTGMVAEVQEACSEPGDGEGMLDESNDSGGSSTDSVADSDADGKSPAPAAMSTLRAPPSSRGFPQRKSVTSA